MFHRKIHPESSVAAREFIKSKKQAKITPKEGDYTNGNLKHLGGYNGRLPQGSMPMKETQCSKNNKNSPQQNSLSCNNLRGKGEHWIKIDEDCK